MLQIPVSNGLNHIGMIREKILANYKCAVHAWFFSRPVHHLSLNNHRRHRLLTMDVANTHRDLLHIPKIQSMGQRDEVDFRLGVGKV